MLKLAKTKSFRIRQTKIKDAIFLIKLFNINVKKGNFFTKKQIPLNNHLYWLKNRLKEKNFYIIYDKENIGYIRLDNISKKKFLISIAIIDKYRGRGIAKEAFFKAMKKSKLKNVQIIASIKRSNKKSICFFKRCGFKRNGNTNNYILEY